LNTFAKSNNMKRILVPCDFSEPSREAFKLAVNIASKTSGEVFVLHVIHIPILYDPTLAGASTLAVDPLFLSEIEADAKKQFIKMKNDLAGAVKVNIQITQGVVVTAIKRIIKDQKIDLVIMGTTGASGLQEIFVGSTTEKVVRHSPVPVLSVRTAPDIDSIKKILLPTTLGLNQTEFVGKLKELLYFLDATLHILLINTPLNFRSDLEAKASLAEFVEHYKLKDCRLHFRNYRTAQEGIIRFARDEQIDLIAMATHAWKGIVHLFTGSVTEDLVNNIPCPVWTYSLKE
jgi:nucleotide-binding universal stress UspA family protein